MTLLLSLIWPIGPLVDVFNDLYIQIHKTTGLSWAWSIVALTAIVRIAIMPVTVRQTQSMLRMQVLQPYIKQIQQKFKDDRQALNEALMSFYKDNSVNPLASCLPLLLQLPVFIALFYTLRKFQPPHALSQDLSFFGGFVPNILHQINHAGAAGAILIVMYAASTMLSTLVMATSPDPKQRLMFLILPLVFIPFVLKFPVGVLIYWITTNLWTIGQYLVVRRMTKLPSEIVMPPDNRGRTKTVKPKNRPQEKASDAPTAKSSDAAPSAQQHARRNKRRR